MQTWTYYWSFFYGFIMAFEKFNTEEFENYVLLTQTVQCLFFQKCQTIIIVTEPVHSLFVVLWNLHLQANSQITMTCILWLTLSK